jgi:hypothetical protein
LPPGTISDGTSRALVTFAGLFGASLLPTITLLVNGMTANGRSVYAIEKLDIEIGEAMDALLRMFGWTAIAFGGLVTLSISPPSLWQKVPLLTFEILPRAGQGLVGLAVAAIVISAGQIPAILRRTLAMRKEIAIDEARRKLAESVPDRAAVRAAFPSHPEFGKVVKLDNSKE